MSVNYTTIRLWWDGRRGQAQYDGVVRELTVKPDAFPDLEEIDYTPAFDTYRVLRKHGYGVDARDDLRPPEIAAVVQWLKAFAASVKLGK